MPGRNQNGDTDPALPKSPQWWALLISVALCFGAAGVGSRFTGSSVSTWYQGLIKPGWTPPDVVFGPVWTLLYILMAVAAWLVWRRGERFSLPLILFVCQLVLNAGWSALFFGLRRPDLAFIEIQALWIAILATAVTFRRVDPLAGWLLLPYLLWTGFAVALNAAIWQLNS